MSTLYTLAALAAYSDGPAPLSSLALAALAGTGAPIASPATLRDVVAALERRPYGAPLDDLPRELVAPARLTRRFPALCPVARSGAEPCTLAFSGDERLGAVALACVCGCVEVRPAYAGALSSAPRVHTRRAASGAGWVVEPAPARSPYILDDSRWIVAADAVAAVARLGAARALDQLNDGVEAPAPVSAEVVEAPAPVSSEVVADAWVDVERAKRHYTQALRASVEGSSIVSAAARRFLDAARALDQLNDGVEAPAYPAEVYLAEARLAVRQAPMTAHRLTLALALDVPAFFAPEPSAELIEAARAWCAAEVAAGVPVAGFLARVVERLVDLSLSSDEAPAPVVVNAPAPVVVKAPPAAPELARIMAPVFGGRKR